MGRLLLQLLLNSIIFINATSLCRSSYENSDLPNRYRLPVDVIPVNYEIELEPYFETEGKSFNFSGSCQIYIKILNLTRCISLHAENLQIDIQNVIVYNTEYSYSLKPINVTYNNETHIITFHFEYELLEGKYRILMNFIGLSDNDGILYRTYINRNGSKGWFVARQFRAIGARQLFPCWDEPAFKSTFTITIKHHRKNVAFSNTPIKYKTFDENIQTTKFRESDLMSTYLVTLALYDNNLSWVTADYESTIIYDPSEDTTFVHYFIYDVRKIINVWKYTSSSYFAYVKHLITPAGPQHNGIGLIIYKISKVFYNPTLDPVSQKIKVARLIAYEMARQWFNSLISPSWWSYHWLHEGIARLLGMAIINQIFPDFRLLDLFAVQSKQECLYLDHFISGIMNPLISDVNKSSEIDSFFSFSYYIKAPVILFMLQDLTNSFVFKQGIEIFLGDHLFYTATIDHFWSAMLESIVEESKYSYTPVDKRFNVTKMNTWTKHKHFPVLKISYPEDCENLIISIENVYSLAKDKWFIPIILIIIEPELNFRTTTWKYWEPEIDFSSNPSLRLNISCKKDEVIISNSYGYYRVIYEPEHWLKIARYLNDESYMNIDVRTRAQIIDDAFYFFSMNQLNINTFLELTKYLSQETDYVAWYPMIKALERMSRFFPILDERMNFVKEAMQNILNNVLERLGYEELSEEDYPINYLRQEVAKWACILKHPKCLEMAKYLIGQHVIKHKKLLPWWKEWTYCNGLMTEINLTGIWKIVLEKWMVNPNDRIFEFLTCIAHPNSIKTYLNDNNLEATVSLKNISLKIRDIDRVNRFLFTIIKHAKNDEILEHILNNFKELKLPRAVNKIAMLIIIINHVYSHSQLEKIERFADNNLRKEIDEILKYTRTLIENTFLQKEFDKAVHEYMKNLINQLIEKRSQEIIHLRQIYLNLT